MNHEFNYKLVKFLVLALLVGVREAFRDLSRFVPFLVLFGWVVPSTPYLTALIGGQFLWFLCHESIRPCHSFAFHFNLCLPTLSWLLWHLVLGCPTLCCCSYL
jgi:hypothetical protein